MKLRLLILLLATGAIATVLTHPSAWAQAKPRASAPKSEAALRQSLKAGKIYSGSGFVVKEFRNGTYVVWLTEGQVAKGKTEAKNFFTSIKASSAKITWRTGSTLSSGESRLPAYVRVIGQLPRETKTHRVYFDDYYNKVVVVPKVDIRADRNPTDELERLWPTYQKYTNEAITWLKDQGFTSKELDLEIWMEDFWPQGKSIKKP